MVANSRIKDYIHDIESLHSLLLSDACFSGSLFVRGERNDRLTLEELGRMRSRWAICSGRHNELVSDGPKAGHSPFAQSILDVLGSSTRSHITTNFLFEQVREQTRSNYIQLPDGGPLYGVGHKRGEYVFVRKDHSVIAAVDTVKHTSLSREEQRLATSSNKKNTVSTAQDRLGSLKKKTLLMGGILLVICLLLIVGIVGWQLTSANKPEREMHDPLGQELGENKGEEVQPNAPEREKEVLVPDDSKDVIRKEDLGQEIESQPLRKDFVVIEGGTFMMGDVNGENYDREKPVHEVTLDKYALSKYEVTFEAYDAFCTATGRQKPDDQGWGRGLLPVINVNWYDAILYCNWLTEQEGYEKVYQVMPTPASEEPYAVAADFEKNGYRLPTEAEWEFAARQRGENVRYGNGAQIIDPANVNFLGREDRRISTSIAGAYRRRTVFVGNLENANKLGLYDMSGNVNEWCWDRATPYHREPVVNPRGGGSVNAMVVRGGGWNNNPGFCRAVFRRYEKPTWIEDNLGFRVAKKM